MAMTFKQLTAMRLRGEIPNGPIVLSLTPKPFQVPDEVPVIDMAQEYFSDMRALVCLWVIIVADEDTLDAAVNLASRIAKHRPDFVEVANRDRGLWASAIEYGEKNIMACTAAWELVPEAAICAS